MSADQTKASATPEREGPKMDDEDDETEVEEGDDSPR